MALSMHFFSLYSQQNMVIQTHTGTFAYITEAKFSLPLLCLHLLKRRFLARKQNTKI